MPRSPEAIARAIARRQRPEVVAAKREYAREYQRNLGYEGRQAKNLWNTHRMTPVGKQAMLDAQDGCCYLCGDPLTFDAAVIDHDHDCCPPPKTCPTCRRGLACLACNSIIGLARDDPARLLRIAANLETVLPAVKARIATKDRQLAFDIPDPAALDDAA